MCVVAKQQPGRVKKRFSQPRANSCISGMVLETKSNAPKQASSSDSTNGAKSAMQSMSINKAAASSSASAAAAADFEDISCKERFKCTGQEIFNALTQREMIQVKVAGKDDSLMRDGLDKLTTFLLTGVYECTSGDERSQGRGALRDVGRKHSGRVCRGKNRRMYHFFDGTINSQDRVICR